MMRFWLIAALTAVTLTVTACGSAIPGARSQEEATQGEEGTAALVGIEPDDDLSSLRTEVGQTRTGDGARVTLDWAYADERFVAVGLHTQTLDDAQKPEGSDSGSVVLELSLWNDTHGDEAELPPYVQITDASGQDFDLVGGGTLQGPRRTGSEAVFDAPEGLQPGRKHRFRLEVPVIYESGPSGMQREKPAPGTFVFVFEVPVLPASTIELNQRVEAEGITLTLKRVVNSPLLPQAVVCFEPPDDEHHWMAWLKNDPEYDPGSPEEVGSAPQQLGNGCWPLEMDAPVEGRSSVTVTHLEGIPRGGSSSGSSSGAKTNRPYPIHPKIIRGPWTFEFEGPDR